MPTDLVVVDNGSYLDISPLVIRQHRLIGGTARLHFVGLAENRGSAAGFAAGIELAARLTNEDGLILLLDDDTIPSPGSMRKVVTAAEQTADHAGAFLMNRPAQRNIREACRTGRDIEYPTDSYAGFSLRLVVRQRLIDRLRPPVRALDNEPLAGSAPYAGLVIRRAHVEVAGLPDRRLVLYEDDTEFTLRLVSATGKIRILSSAELHDLDPSWKDSSGTFVKAADVDSPEFRAYYSIRNRRFIERQSQRPFSGLVAVNSAIYFALVALDLSRQALRPDGLRKVYRRIKLIRSALRAARMGDFDDPKYPLP